MWLNNTTAFNVMGREETDRMQFVFFLNSQTYWGLFLDFFFFIVRWIYLLALLAVVLLTYLLFGSLLVISLLTIFLLSIYIKRSFIKKRDHRA